MEGRTPAPLDVAWGLALLAGAVASVALAIVQWSARSLSDLVAGNYLAVPDRLWTLLVVIGCAVVTGLAGAVYALVRRRTAGPRIERAARLCCPLLVACFLPALFVRAPWVGNELPYLGLLAVASLLLEQLLRVSLAEWHARPLRLPWPERARRLWDRVADKGPAVVVGLAVAYYVVLIGRYTLISHLRMTTQTADLGEYDNQFFNSLHGHPFRLPASEGDLRNWSALKFHADFIIYALLPLYAIRPGPEALLIIQTVFIAVTAVPIYLFAARRLPRWIAALVALAFLLMPVIERPNFYDFHAVPIGMFFAAWAIWGVDRILHAPQPRRRDYLLFWTAFVLALASREDIAFGMIIVSLVVLFTQRKATRLALWMLGTSGLYFVAIKFLIMPLVGRSWYDAVYNGIKAQGFRGYGAVVVSMLTNPVFVLRSMLTEAKLLFVLHMAAPLLFLWTRRPHLLIAVVPSLFFTLMVSDRPPMFQSSFQYCYQWFPYIVIASILALQGMAGGARGRIPQTAAALALALAAGGAGFQYGVLLGGDTIVGGFSTKLLTASPEDHARYRDLRALADRIPPQASVAATEAEGPHVSTRLVLYNIRYGLGDNPEYILINRGLGGVEAQRVLGALDSGHYGVVAQQGQFVLLRRGHDRGGNAGLIEELRRR